MDRDPGDIHSNIVDHELSIRRELLEAVLEYDMSHDDVTVRCGIGMTNIVDLAADIDCIQSLACCALEYGLCRPEFVDDPVLLIEDGYVITDQWS